ncbi:MAG: membrane dipeptidase [Planctomycetota bacterium]
MAAPLVPRRTFLEAALLSLGAGMTASGAQPAVSPLERAAKYRLRPKTLKRIEAGHQAFLNELKPTKAQIDRGLQLHYDSFVGDAQGGVSVTYEGALLSDRMLAVPGSQRFKAKTFESAYEPQWIEESRALYEIAGVALAAEDVAHPNENDFEKALRLLARSSFAYDRRPDLLRVTGFDTIQQGRREGRPCVVQHMAAVGGFAETEDPVANLDLFYALGVRSSQLTYIQKNALCCSWFQFEDTGLTDAGRQVVRRMNELGIMVDLAHCGQRTSMDVIEVSEEPVLISHTGSKAVYDDATNQTYIDAVMAQPYARGVPRPEKTASRHVADDALRALAEKGGLAAFYVIHSMLNAEGDRSFNAWYRHLEHAIEVVGIDRVAIGTDSTFFPTWPPSPLDWTNWPYWTVGLVTKGLADEEVRKVIGGNYLRYCERVLSKRPWGEFM